MRYELWLGLKYLFAKRQERFISVIALLSIGGVALGVAALLVVLAVMSGFDRDIKDRLVGTNAHLIVESPQGVREVSLLLRKLSAMPEVVGVSPFIMAQAIVRLPQRAFGVWVRGIDVERESRVNRLAEYLVLGSLPKQENEVVIGTELAALLERMPGSTIPLISPSDGKTREFLISGLFRSGMYEYDATLLAMRLDTAQQFFQLEGVVSGIGMKLARLERASEVAGQVEQNLGENYQVKTWMDLNPALFGALRVEKTVMFVILTLIVLVAALNIMAMLIMIVMEKTKDIGILRALGATRSSVARLFLAQGCAVGLLGISLGIISGLALANHLNSIVQWLERHFGISLFPPTIYYLDHIPTAISFSDIVAVVTATFLLTLLAGTYAAVRAAQLAPVDALRYE